MRQQFLCDGIENFDFHVERRLECQKLSKLILDGSYAPQRAQRILVEKSKGLCRQLVIPTVRDALVLQCLSDALYKQIRGKSPTDKAFFEPKEHKFSSVRSRYGTFASWLNFQKELFKFSKIRQYIVVTDIANYYDTISYTHLRNAISGMTDAKECVLDMLIFILSDLLWQPDYSPRVEVGLPQINLDAPRLLAHCFLYELDEYLASDPTRDFVRYMDDIDIGVDDIVSAKNTLKSVDLVLQTKQVRLNSGKTQILTRKEAIRHFRVFENARLDMLQARIDRRLKVGLPVDRERRLVELRIRNGIRARKFDAGNGEKILKRWITLAARLGAKISPTMLDSLIRLRPNSRENVLAYIRSMPLTAARARTLQQVLDSGWLIDDASAVDLVNYLIETKVVSKYNIRLHIDSIIRHFDANTFYGFYCKIWMTSKYGSPQDIIQIIQSNRSTWTSQERLGRLVGSLRPIMINSPFSMEYMAEISRSMNSGANDTNGFHVSLSESSITFNKMKDALSNPNPSRGTNITHPKFLCLLSALQNAKVTSIDRARLKENNKSAFEDVYYREIHRISIK